MGTHATFYIDFPDHTGCWDNVSKIWKVVKMELMDFSATGGRCVYCFWFEKDWPNEEARAAAMLGMHKALKCTDWKRDENLSYANLRLMKENYPDQYSCYTTATMKARNEVSNSLEFAVAGSQQSALDQASPAPAAPSPAFPADAAVRSDMM